MKNFTLLFFFISIISSFTVTAQTYILQGCLIVEATGYPRLGSPVYPFASASSGACGTIYSTGSPSRNLNTYCNINPIPGYVGTYRNCAVDLFNDPLRLQCGIKVDIRATNCSLDANVIILLLVTVFISLVLLKFSLFKSINDFISSFCTVAL